MYSTDDTVELIGAITNRPSMYVRSASYDCVTAFLRGYDAALGGSVFEGLHEWLCVMYDKSYSVGWEQIIVVETLREPERGQLPEGESSHPTLLSALKEVLTRFLRHRGEIGLRNVLYDCGVWRRQEPWRDEHVERYGRSLDAEEP